MLRSWVSPALVLAQQLCPNGIRIDGVVTDPTGALIAGAQVHTADGMKTTTDTAGRFVLSCVPVTSETITVQADGFSPGNPTAALLAPRPIAPNENIFNYENSGHLNGTVLSVSLGQHSYKRFGIDMSAYTLHFKCDAPLQIAPPQSSYSNRGESSRVDWLSSGGSVDGTLNLPGTVLFATQFSARTGRPYNITTGTDANGDGTFNDRPSYASVPGPGVYNTPFGLLTANTVNGNVPRNLGTMPSIWHLSSNLSRTFVLNPRDKDHTDTHSERPRCESPKPHQHDRRWDCSVSNPWAADLRRGSPTRRTWSTVYVLRLGSVEERPYCKNSHLRCKTLERKPSKCIKSQKGEADTLYLLA